MSAPQDPPNYNPNIPLSFNNIAQSEQLLLDNFEEIFRIFNQNHVMLNATTGLGNHEVIELAEQNTPQTTQSQEVAIYSKKVTGQTDQIFVRYPGNGKEFQLTQYQVYPLSPLKSGATIFQIPFFTFLPGGLIVYFGKIIPFGNPFNIVLDPPICTNIVSINLCPIGAANAANYQSNVKLQGVNGKFVNVVLNASPAIPLNQYYMIIGNI